MSSPAVAMIHPHGRATPARVRVLDLLLAAPHPLSHAEIEEQLEADAQLDRVTLYRVLDWLVSQGLAHKVATENRSWRFRAVARETRHHAHFHCSRCGRVFCLDDSPPSVNDHLPPGFRAQQVELNIRGLCALCAVPD